MKELYTSPELEIVRFLPLEGIAKVINLDDGLSDTESLPGDYNEGVDTDPLL